MGEYVGVKRLDVFLNYAMYRLIARRREEIYQIYVTDHLKALLGSSKRFIDYINPKPDINADEIVLDIIERAGLVAE